MSRWLIDALDRLDAGDWDGAHELAQADETDAGAWLHAHLHRIEGDEANANYWYRRAGRTPFTGTIEDERTALRDALR
ncbi:hypothetical protein SAMN04488020_105175 [Palleronia marisminoris]|uniref:Uncharacterized protein n=1 Tax=Palleronia marisminoris TaxID=315423 RepID=A0A1Y5SXW9_9RHOB|nr:hypothetical protein [Palleronia marisminoris]SFG97137.1 hypothetical protein SAMN04488020_105175 [Palleronia marisminoris]SLN47639.1 hypothetical protein PAM7066_02119 [Palleronia marisminoris]